MMTKPPLTIDSLIALAREFCDRESNKPNKELFGVTDGKAVGTHMERKFKLFLQSRYEFHMGNAARGIDLPSKEINTDIKVTSIRQPQSSCPFKNVHQKIYGLGYNLLVFVYDKRDDAQTKTAVLNFVSCSFIEKERTGDYQMTTTLRRMINNHSTAEDIFAYLITKQVPAHEMSLRAMAEQILENPPIIGCLTISNALQWRLNYGRVVEIRDEIEGITKIVDKI